MRINKFIARGLGLSRRQADDAVARGEVTINGTVAILGQSTEESDEVHYKGKKVTLEPYKYVLLNKPVGYVCSRKKQDDTETVYSLLPQKYHHLKTAGRLDKDSSGVILLTDDGDYIHKLTHPGSGKIKVYEATLERPLTESDLDRVNTGVELTDGVSTIETATISDSTYRLTMHEGRNRQIRRTFGELGYTVTKLHRTQFGPYLSGDLDTTYQHTTKK